MLDKKELKEMNVEFKRQDNERENLIKKSRDILKLSKQIIYSVHRGDISEADKLVHAIEKEAKELDKIAGKHAALEESGSFRVAYMEYVEAVLYYNFVKNKKIPTRKELRVSIEHYLLGLCDLTGELVRKAVFLAGKGKVNEVIKIKELVDEIYGELLKFDFRENELRRKFDAVKYDLRKLEDLVLDLKLKGKL